MSTNYYHRTNLCQCCGRYDQRHIGKLSSGWSFSFHGYFATPLEPEGTPRLVSWQDWDTYLGVGGEIFNEYEEHVTRENFTALVLESRTARMNQFRYFEANQPSFALKGWVDAEGYSFSTLNFS